MGAFGGMLQTTKGRNLQAKAQTGVQLNFTRIAVGDGELGGSSILDLNALKHEVKSLSISKFKPSAGQATIGAVLSNQDITSGFYWRELGLFAEDPDIGEILYCYGNAGGNAEYIPAGGGADIIEKAVDIISIFGNATNVSATINTSLVYASAQDLQDHENDSSAHNLAGKISHSLATAVNDFLVASGVGVFVKKSLAEVKSILGLGSAAYKAESYFETPSGAQTKADAAAAAGVSAASTVQGNLDTHKADYVRQPAFGSTTGGTGTPNAYAFASNPALPSLIDGVSAYLDINAANTGAATLNWDSKGAKPIVDGKGNALIAGKLPLNSIIGVRYNASTGNFQLLGEGGEYGTATQTEVLSGYTLGTANGIVNGSLALTGTAGVSDVAVGKTFYNTNAKAIQTGTSTAKKPVTGSVTSDSSKNINVTGLSINPSIVILQASDGGNIGPLVLYCNKSNLGTSYDINIWAMGAGDGNASNIVCGTGSFQGTTGIANKAYKYIAF